MQSLSNYIKESNTADIVVTTYGNKRTTYSKSDIQSMIDNIDKIWSSDALPAWLYKAGLGHLRPKSVGLPTNKKETIAVLKKIVGNPTRVLVNVASDTPNLNVVNYKL